MTTLAHTICLVAVALISSIAAASDVSYVSANRRAEAGLTADSTASSAAAAIPAAADADNAVATADAVAADAAGAVAAIVAAAPAELVALAATVDSGQAADRAVANRCLETFRVAAARCNTTGVANRRIPSAAEGARATMRNVAANAPAVRDQAQNLLPAVV